MNDQNSMAHIQPERVGMDHSFLFRCHKGVSCFTQCCRGINIILTPYDILRLKNRLGLSSGEFLAIYTTPQMLEKTDLPVITLKLLDDEKNSCPFVRADGCLIYEDRPTTCRYYPLGVASLSHKEGADDKDFFFFIKEPHCRGFEEDTCWTVQEWRQDQGVDIRDDVNSDWTDLLVRKRSFPVNIKLTEQSKQMFFTASYDIDKFRAFVFESSFLDRYDIPADVVDKIKTDEVALLRFALQWLKSVLFKTEAFQLKAKAENGPD